MCLKKKGARGVAPRLSIHKTKKKRANNLSLYEGKKCKSPLYIRLNKKSKKRAGIYDFNYTLGVPAHRSEIMFYEKSS